MLFSSKNELVQLVQQHSQFPCWGLALHTLWWWPAMLDFLAGRITFHDEK